VLLPTTCWVGFTVVSIMLAAGLAQTMLTRQGRSLLPALGNGWRPTRPNLSIPWRHREARADPDRTRVATKVMPTERPGWTDRPSADHTS
jgi:hypothetical protein